MRYVVLSALSALAGLELAAAPAQKTVAEADEQGNVVINDDNEKKINELVRQGRKRRVVPEENGWITKPLGEPGNLVLNKELPNKPVFLPRKRFREGLVLFGPGVKDAVLISQHGPILQHPMNELRYHLEEMIGREIHVQPDLPTDGRAAITITHCPGAGERSRIRVDGGTVYIEGVDAPGISHALTYFLEALGCRYLWPGKSGKIIPKREKVVLPEGLSLDFTPSLKVRRIRSYTALHERRVNALAAYGLDALKYAQRRRMAEIDHFENRDFWRWHGLNDSIAVPGSEPTDDGKIRWEHRFNDYYERFGKTHPEWFALQPDGTRIMDNRPTFCMSNDALAEQMADETIEMYRRDMSVLSHSICLPDGGYKTWCMCEKCRRLDPVNAKKSKLLLILPQGRERRDYVAYTDRVLDFYNRILARVKAALPDKKLSMYAYSCYEAPPVKVKPDPALLILSVAGGSYMTQRDRQNVRESLAAWGTFGNELLWRPNALHGYQACAPQNNARWFFEDLETFKANGLCGTDFDCMTSDWPCRGLVQYALAKAHLNPDRLSYDDVLDDYCAAAFGKGADAMKRYFAALEATYERAAEAWTAHVAAADPSKPIWRIERIDCYVGIFNADDYEKYFDEALSAAAGDEAAVSRISFMREGLVNARSERRLAEAVWNNSPDLDGLKAERRRYVRDCMLRDPFCIGGGGFYLGEKGRRRKN